MHIQPARREITNSPHMSAMADHGRRTPSDPTEGRLSGPQAAQPALTGPDIPARPAATPEGPQTPQAPRRRRLADLITGLCLVVLVAALAEAVPVVASVLIRPPLWLWVVPLAVPAGLLVTISINWLDGRYLDGDGGIR